VCSTARALSSSTAWGDCRTCVPGGDARLGRPAARVRALSRRPAHTRSARRGNTQDRVHAAQRPLLRLVVAVQGPGRGDAGGQGLQPVDDLGRVRAGREVPGRLRRRPRPRQRPGPRGGLRRHREHLVGPRPGTRRQTESPPAARSAEGARRQERRWGWGHGWRPTPWPRLPHELRPAGFRAVSRAAEERARHPLLVRARSRGTGAGPAACFRPVRRGRRGCRPVRRGWCSRC
jgi:hypothetical protein